MKLTEALLREKADEAFDVAWWFRKGHDIPAPARPHVERIEARNPGLYASLDRDDEVTYYRWEGRLATLRELCALAVDDPFGPDTWDGEGAFDS